MSEHKDVSEDENGYFVVQLPAPTAFGRFFERIKISKPPGLVRYSTIGIASVILVLLALFFMPSSLKFSVASETCGFNPMFLPRLSKHISSSSYSVAPGKSLSIGGYPLFSVNTCVTALAPTSPGQEESLKVALLHIPFLTKSFNVSSPDLPLASISTDVSEKVSAIGKLEFQLSHTDNVYDYQISTGQKTNPCQINGDKLTCTLEPLDLKPATDYKATLHRAWSQQPLDELTAAEFTTLDPVLIKKSSIKNKQTVYSKPTEIVLATNKPLSKSGIAKINDRPATTSFTDTKLTIKLPEELEREKNYSLSLSDVIAVDGSGLLEDYKLKFKTSGGPKVKSVNIGSSRVQPWTTIYLGMDAELKSGQKLSKFASLQVGGKSVPASITTSGKSIIINPSSDLPRCRSFKVILKSGLINKYGVGDGKSYTLNSRTLCQVAFSIGSSVHGRSIMAYRFGSGSSRIVLVGGMHGNETSSVATLNAFINYLEDHSNEIPSHRSIVIIPNQNPDGYAAGSRTNANGVDLNRNFPANDWQSSVQMPGGVTASKGGGKKAGDQPETKALMNYINANNPRLVLTFHAVAGIVISNDAGDSSSQGRKYASTSGYRFSTDAGSDDEFGYATTGEFEDWLADKKGEPALLVELSSMYYSQFERQRTALMNLVKLP